MHSHGGSRKGAGRKKSIANEPEHTRRESIDEKTAMHISFKLIRQAPCLRTPGFMKAFARILFNAKLKGLRVQHYTIESNHIHLIAEATDNRSLSCGMMSLTASITWALRRIFMYHGKVFTERYHLHALRNPTEMRNSLRYVLFNHARHTGSAFFADAYSSIFAFADAHVFINGSVGKKPPWFELIARNLTESRSWMQRCGWRKAKH